MTTTDTPSRPPKPVPLPPITCALWCRHGDGHPDQRHPVDQRCETDEMLTHLQLSGWTPDKFTYISTYLERQGAGAKPEIHLGFEDTPGVALTPREARQLARQLRRLASLAGVMC